MKVKTNVKVESKASGLKVKTNVKAGYWFCNRSEKLASASKEIGLTTQWPNGESNTRSSAFVIIETSISLSSGGK